MKYLTYIRQSAVFVVLAFIGLHVLLQDLKHLIPVVLPLLFIVFVLEVIVGRRNFF